MDKKSSKVNTIFQVIVIIVLSTASIILLNIIYDDSNNPNYLTYEEALYVSIPNSRYSGIGFQPETETYKLASIISYDEKIKLNSISLMTKNDSIKYLIFIVKEDGAIQELEIPDSYVSLRETNKNSSYIKRVENKTKQLEGENYIAQSPKFIIYVPSNSIKDSNHEIRNCGKSCTEDINTNEIY